MAGLTTYELTIGDGHSPAKDGRMTLTTEWPLYDLDTWLR
jgi:hypothetical protein